MRVQKERTSGKLRGAARRHKEVIMLAVDERREVVAHILAEGVVRLLATEHDDIQTVPVIEDEGLRHPEPSRKREHLRLVTETKDAGGGR